ncbi:hypothetical protein NKH18_45095 [Streptomyces sp. M10(2022)]
MVTTAGRPARQKEGVVRLSDHWQVTVTRAGLWVGPRGGPPLPYSTRKVSADGPTVEVGVPNERLEASLWPALSGLLGALSADLRERATLHVHGTAADGGRELRRIAAHHGLRKISFALPVPGRRLSAPERTAGARTGPGAMEPPSPVRAAVAPDLTGTGPGPDRIDIDPAGTDLIGTDGTDGDLAAVLGGPRSPASGEPGVTRFRPRTGNRVHTYVGARVGVHVRD